MSWQPAPEPSATDDRTAAIDLVIEPRTHDLGDGFEVRRVLPFAKRHMVGPFIFFDHFGPTMFRPGTGLDVRPHPHIGLATVTYLFAGEIMHRDSLGTTQLIRPGAVNWMTAGRGIVHSERTPPETRGHASPIYGIQSWVALPKTREEIAPAFEHYPAASLPLVDGDGVSARLIAGTMFGQTSPVTTQSPLFYADVTLRAGAILIPPADYAERAAYLLEGAVECAGARHAPPQMLVFGRKARAAIKAVEPARLLLLGGEPLDGERHIWWNLVSSSPDRIEQAKRDWKAGRFPKVPGDSEEFIPLPA
ncbi:MAG: pirin family protein [Alphaproteobacteria bacterium]|nr:pirin family protein [Alphaproteobacteria bacterium]